MGSQQSLFDTLIHRNNRSDCKRNQYRKHSHASSISSINSFQSSAFHFSSNSRNHTPRDCCALWKAIKSMLGIWTTGNSEIDEIIKETQRNASKHNKPWKWIPYEKFENVIYLTEGGYSQIFSAWCTDRDLCGRVALKSLEFSENISSEYLQQLRTLARLKNSGGFIRIYGVTRDPKTNYFMLVMKHAKCNLRQYLDKYFNTISLSNKIELLVPISNGLKKIHQEGLSHGNLHPGNILLTLINNPTERRFSTTTSAKIYATPKTWSCISDLGLCGPASNIPRQFFSEKNEFVDEPETLFLKNVDDDDIFDGYLLQEKQQDYFTTFITPSRSSRRKSSVYEKPKVYGVLPYIAPEVLKGQKYTKAADVYSFGFIIYEVFTGHPPYNNVPHNLKLAQNICKGHRPEITSSEVPHRVVKLITSCWDSRPENRPTAQEIHNTMIGWYWRLDPEMTSLMRADDEAYRGIRSGTPIKDSGFSTPSQTPQTPPTPGTPGTPNSPLYASNPFTTPLNTNLPQSYISNNPCNLSPVSPDSSMSCGGQNYKIHPEAIYTSRLLEYDNLPETESWYY